MASRDMTWTLCRSCRIMRSLAVSPLPFLTVGQASNEFLQHVVDPGIQRQLAGGLTPSLCPSLLPPQCAQSRSRFRRPAPSHPLDVVLAR